jgi:hypothetical protein
MSASECITALLLHAYQTARLAVTFLVFLLSDSFKELKVETKEHSS